MTRTMFRLTSLFLATLVLFWLATYIDIEWTLARLAGLGFFLLWLTIWVVFALLRALVREMNDRFGELYGTLWDRLDRTDEVLNALGAAVAEDDQTIILDRRKAGSLTNIPTSSFNNNDFEWFWSATAREHPPALDLLYEGKAFVKVSNREASGVLEWLDMSRLSWKWRTAFRR